MENQSVEVKVEDEVKEVKELPTVEEKVNVPIVTVFCEACKSNISKKNFSSHKKTISHLKNAELLDRHTDVKFKVVPTNSDNKSNDALSKFKQLIEQINRRFDEVENKLDLVVDLLADDIDEEDEEDEDKLPAHNPKLIHQ